MKFNILLLALISTSFVHSQTQHQRAIKDILRAYVPNENTPGLSLGIVQDGKIVLHESRGWMNLEYHVPFNDSSVFPLASVSKQFTSACIAVLEKQGKLSVEDDVTEHIPELFHLRKGLRIKHLLNHSSGIRNHNVLLDLKGFDLQHRGYTNRMIETLMFQQKGTNNAPGEKMLYSNTNYVLLALIVERVSGLPIHKFAQEALFEPLEMRHTFYQRDLELPIENRAYAYYLSDGNYLQTKSLTLCVGAGGVYSTVEDLSKWAAVFLHPKHSFSYLKDFITTLDTLNNGEKMKHARGMFISPYRNHITFNHSGRDLGMRSQFLCVPDQDLAIIVFANLEGINAVNLSYEVLDLFLGETVLEESLEHQYEHTSKEKKQFEGIYQELNSDLRMEVFVENDTLKARSSFGRSATALISQSKGTWCRIDNPSIVYTFQQKPEEEAQLLVDFGGAIFYFERIELNPNPNENLIDFLGSYYSAELDVHYHLTLENGQLLLSCEHKEGFPIYEGEKDTFGANRRTKYTFQRNELGKVWGFLVAAEGTVKDILFEKLDQ